MPERFTATPEHIAGYSRLTDNVSQQLMTLSNYVQNNAGATADFSGVMGLLTEPVNAYASTTGERIKQHVYHLYETSLNLRMAAWEYHGVEADAYLRVRTRQEELDKRNDGQVCYPDGAKVHPKDSPDAVSYPVGTDPTSELKPPEVEDASIRPMLDHVGGVLNVIDDVVATVTRWSPVSEITEPISGNWNALRGCGEALKNAGGAVEESLENLTRSLPKLEPHWNGGAAQSFNGYITRLVDGAGQEGPLNRVVGGAYGLIADQIAKVAKFVVNILGKVADQIWDRAVGALVPVYGWVRLKKFIESCIEVFNKAREMIMTVKSTLAQANNLIDMAKDPVGAAKSGIEQTLKPIEESVDTYKRGAEVARDLAEVSDTAAWRNAPDRDYTTTGKGGEADPRRPGA